jgi:hypothetical protein
VKANFVPRLGTFIGVAEPHHFYAALGENYDAAPTLLYSKAKVLKQTNVYTHIETILIIRFCTIFAENMN